ncbi:MAG TPA: polysaccharide biosynthesis tyrosine autokinase [Nitrospirota bacterium]|nr:polysaccharide biosynthesis tyrosine autokinase [Nitrospirota bacterium]
MSRIENALEKASRMREGKRETGAVQETVAHRERKIVRAAAEAIPLDNPYLVAYNKPYSPASEEYKKLKSQIIGMTKQEPGKNVILVTSAVGGEGKSITAANLALSLSQDHDHSVLLIDGDMRKPTLCQLFQVEPERGLSDCVAEDLDIGSALITLGNGNLAFLSSGNQDGNPVELVSSQRMKKALESMKHRYSDRFIIIDTPPVLLFAETKILSSLADGIIFVVKEGRAPQQHVLDALEALRGENIMGIVYNGAGSGGLNGRSAYHSYYSDYLK